MVVIVPAERSFQKDAKCRTKFPKISPKFAPKFTPKFPEFLHMGPQTSLGRPRRPGSLVLSWQVEKSNPRYFTPEFSNSQRRPTYPNRFSEAKLKPKTKTTFFFPKLKPLFPWKPAEEGKLKPKTKSMVFGFWPCGG